MSGPHQFPPSWGGEEDSDVGGFGRPSTSDSDFLSEFFVPLSSDASPGVTVSRAEAEAEAAHVSGDAAVRVTDEEVDNSPGKESDAKHPSASKRGAGGDRKEEAGGNSDYPHKRKRNRTTEMHNMTERRRRDKIKGKLKALQELIPNSHKLDRASLLDETIAYVKSLQMQIQMMSSGGLCHSPYMAHSPVSCLHVPHISPFSRMGMGMSYGMGMANMGCPVPPPMMSIPSPHQPTSFVPMAGYNTIPAFCPLSQAVPFAPMPEFAAAMTTSIPSPPILQAGPFTSHRGAAVSQEEVTNENPTASQPISTSC